MLGVWLHVHVQVHTTTTFLKSAEKRRRYYLPGESVSNSMLQYLLREQMLSAGVISMVLSKFSIVIP
jgi:hypothetical protein